VTDNTDFARTILFNSLHKRGPAHDELENLDLPNAVKAFASEVADKAHGPEVIASVLVLLGNVLGELIGHIAREQVVDALVACGAKEAPRFTLLEDEEDDSPEVIDTQAGTIQGSMWLLAAHLLKKFGGEVTITQPEQAALGDVTDLMIQAHTDPLSGDATIRFAPRGDVPDRSKLN